MLSLSGKGTPREKEFANACKFLGVDEHTCANDEKLIDGLKEKWCEETVRKYVGDYVRDHNIKAVFTFDKHGVSDHPNHIALFNAMKEIEVKPDTKDCIKIYYL